MKTLFITTSAAKFRPTPSDALKAWDHLNEVCFDSELERPAVLRMHEPDILRRYNPGHETSKGELLGHVILTGDQKGWVIMLASSFINRSEFLTVLAHEMVHQALGQQYAKTMPMAAAYQKMLADQHGPVFQKEGAKVTRFPKMELLLPGPPPKPEDKTK